MDNDEVVFNGFNFGISWAQFGNAREQDIDLLFIEEGVGAVDRIKLVDMWKRHPLKVLAGIFPYSLPFPI
jgi:hypothetical protein